MLGHGGIGEDDGERLLERRQKGYSAKYDGFGLAWDGYSDLGKEGTTGLDPLVCECNEGGLDPMRALRSGTVDLDHHLSCYLIMTHNEIGFHYCIFLGCCKVAVALLAIDCENVVAR